MTELVHAEPLPSSDDERWTHGLHLVGQWLVEFAGNSRSTYADAIGWPYRANGEWRGYDAVRHGRGWLGWCHTNGVHLFDAQRLHAHAWVQAINSSGLAKHSRAQMVSAASSFYRWAVFEGHTEQNPMAFVDRKKQGLQTGNAPSSSRSLSRDEMRAMVAAADHDPVEAVQKRTAAILALLSVGPRVSELCHATLADMKVIDGRRALHVVLKGGKDHYFALPPMVCARLDAYLASRTDVQRLPARRGEVSASTTPLIATATGKPMRRADVLALTKRVAGLAGLDDPKSVHPHVFRHTYITEARRQGHATDEIKDSVGHQFSSTTDKYGKHIIALERSPAYGVAEAFEPAVAPSNVE